MPYKGPGFYNEMGVRVCSLHPESLQEFVDSLGYAYVPDKKEFNEFHAVYDKLVSESKKGSDKMANGLKDNPREFRGFLVLGW